MSKRPGGSLATRPLHMFWICDCSGSMGINGKIQSLNEAIQQALPQMREVAEQNPNADVLMRVLTFSHGAIWHTPHPLPLADFRWQNLVADPLDRSSIYADVVFLMDTSGSMSGYIEAVKRSCTSFADQIAREGASVRLGLIGFDIGGHRGKPSLTYSVHNLVRYTLGVWSLTSPEQFKKRAQALTVGLFGGGGSYLADADTVEIFPHVVRVFDGPFMSLRLLDTMRALFGHPRHTRHLVIVSDEMGSNEGLAEIVDCLKAAAITAHVIGVAGPDGAHESLARLTGGQFWDIAAARSSGELDNLFAAVAGTIAREVTMRLSSGALSGGTDMGLALHMVGEQLDTPPMPERAIPPVLVLISDGKPSDDAAAGLHSLLQRPWGRKAVRIAIAIGHDADRSVLQQFIGRPDLEPLQANNPAALVQYIKWISTAVLQSVSAPASTVGTATMPLANIPIPSGPICDGDMAADVW